MIQITTLTNQADMITYATLGDGSVVKFEFIYRPAIQRWTYNVTHPLLTLVGQILTASPNCLRAWKNVIPFGLFCSTADGADPFNQQDFSSGRATLYVLDQTSGDVLSIESTFFGSPQVPVYPLYKVRNFVKFDSAGIAWNVTITTAGALDTATTTSIPVGTWMPSPLVLLDDLGHTWTVVVMPTTGALDTIAGGNIGYAIPYFEMIDSSAVIWTVKAQITGALRTF